MKLTQASLLALRLTLAQNVQVSSKRTDKFVMPTAILLAGIGVGVSSFSLKQLLSKPRHN